MSEFFLSMNVGEVAAQLGELDAVCGGDKVRLCVFLLLIPAALPINRLVGFRWRQARVVCPHPCFGLQNNPPSTSPDTVSCGTHQMAYLVKRAVTTALDRGPRECELVALLINALSPALLPASVRLPLAPSLLFRA